MNEKTEPKAAAPAAASAPAPAEAAAAPAAAAPAKKKKKTGLIIGIIIAILALAGAGVAAYFIFFNKTAAPEDAIANTIEAVSKGSGVTFSGAVKANGFELPVSGKIAKDAAEIDVSFDLSKMSTGTVAMDGKIGAKGIVKNDKIYFSVSGLKDIFGAYASVLGDRFNFDGVWYEAKLEDLTGMLPTGSFKGAEELSKCSTDVSTEEIANIVLSAYKEGKFIEAVKYEGDAVAKKSSDLYTLSIDKEKAEAFAKTIENNEKIADFIKCVGTSASMNTNSTASSVPIYVEFGGDKISRIVMKTDQAELDFDINFQDVNIETPSGDIKSFKELMEVFAPFMGGSNFTPNYNFQTPSYYDYDLDDFDLDDFNLDDYDFDIDLDDYDIDLDNIDYDELFKSLGN